MGGVLHRIGEGQQLLVAVEGGGKQGALQVLVRFAAEEPINSKLCWALQ
jgi:hypothetical protein